MRRPLCWLAAAFFLILFLAVERRDWKDSVTVFPQKEVTLTGKIKEKTQKNKGSWELVLEKVSCEEKHNIILDGNYLLRISIAQEPLLGQWILVKAKVHEWEEISNPGQFDLGRWYHSKGIMGEFRKGELLGKTEEYSLLKEGMWQFRNQCLKILLQYLGEKEGSVISAMILGEKEDLDEETRELYQRSGISHVLAISGLHLMLLGMGTFRLLKLVFPWGKGAEVLASCFMILYCIFSGGSISTIRATIMFVLTLMAKTLGRSYDSLTALALAALIQLLNNPYAMENSGFLLSFLAVVGVTYVAPGIQLLFQSKKKFLSSLIISISASLTTLPVLLDDYGVFCWYGIFLNLLILPPMSILLGGGVLLILISYPVSMEMGGEVLIFFQKSLIAALKLILWFYEFCCKIFEQLPFQDGYLGSPSYLQIIIYYVLLFLLILSIKHTVPFLSNVTIFWKKVTLLLIVSFLTLKFSSGCQITMLDVGQGDCVVIKNSNENVYLSDCGSSSIASVGKYRLLPFLKEKGYGVIRAVFLSHLDQDHYNGVIELLTEMERENIRIESLVLSHVAGEGEEREKLQELLLLAQKNGVSVKRMKEGDYFQDKNLEILCLYPGKEAVLEGSNSNSMVLQVSYDNNFHMLLTGDVEKEGEEKLTDVIRREYDVLKVAHHGSSGSSKTEFLQAVNPKISLISYGKNNPYGHPHEETIERLEACGSRILNTADSGAITIKIGRKKVEIEKFKNRN